jgi:hypothetical protein
MPILEQLYLAGVIVAFATFAAALAFCSFTSSKLQK